MNRSIPWFLFVVALIAFGVSFSELERMRGRFGEVTRHQFHDHLDVRQFVIRGALAGLDRPIVILGDSITEMARFPEAAEGYPIVNAGIGGATIADFVTLAPNLLNEATPSACVVALGANDVGSTTVGQEYRALLSKLRKRCPKLLAVAVLPMNGAEMINSQIVAAANSEGVRVIDTYIIKSMLVLDGVHLSSEGSKQWAAAVVAALSTPRS
jgi:lysophospholipase L1-like esterase